MKFVINTLLFVVVGVSLASADVFVNTWQYWAIMTGIFGIALNAVLW